MLTYARMFRMPELGLSFAAHDYAHPDFRVRIERSHGVDFDEALVMDAISGAGYQWTGYRERPRIDLLLKGEMRLTENGVSRWLRPGDYAFGRAHHSLYVRTRGTENIVLAAEWNVGSLGTYAPIGLSYGRLEGDDLAAVVAATERLLDEDTEQPLVRPLADLFARLRAAGVPFDSWRARDLVSPVPPLLQNMAHALSHSLSNLAAAPKSDHLAAALGVSKRRINELVKVMTARYGVGSEDWRATRNRWRLTSAAIAMGHPLARTETVAAAVGYQSPNALCHAFRLAHLPSPGAIRNALD